MSDKWDFKDDDERQRAIETEADASVQIAYAPYSWITHLIWATCIVLVVCAIGYFGIRP